MKKKYADEPLCPKCNESSYDMIDRDEWKKYTEFTCKVCCHTWVVKKELAC